MNTTLASRELGSTGLDAVHARVRRRGHRQSVSRAARRRRRRRGARIVHRRRALLRHRAVLRLRLERAAARPGIAWRAATAGDLHQGRPPPRAHGSAGCKHRPRGIFLGATVRAGVRLRLRLGHAFARREPRASRRCARRYPAVPRHRPAHAWRFAQPREYANFSTAAIAQCASFAMPARCAPSASA